MGREVFKREGAYVYLWRIHVDVWQKPLQYYKVIILQFKIKDCKKKKRQLWSFFHLLIFGSIPNYFASTPGRIGKLKRPPHKSFGKYTLE